MEPDFKGSIHIADGRVYVAVEDGQYSGYSRDLADIVAERDGLQAAGEKLCQERDYYLEAAGTLKDTAERLQKAIDTIRTALQTEGPVSLASTVRRVIEGLEGR